MVLDTPKGLKAARDQHSTLSTVMDSTSNAVAQAEEYLLHLIYQPNLSSKSAQP